MRSLLWKEWHEQSWKLAFSCVLLAAIAAIGLHSRILSDADTLLGTCFVGLLLPIFYCSGLIPAERAEGSFESLVALPIAPKKILLAKTILGLGQCAVPLLLAMGISLLIAGNREADSWRITSLYAHTIFAASVLLFWMLAFTSQLPSETRAALLSLGIWISLGMAGIGLKGASDALALWTPIPFALTGFVNHETSAEIWAVAVQTATALLLWFWTAARFTHNAKELV
jgi:ABC-type transport system involved in multi-copper enzyme maturation permease subunit